MDKREGPIVKVEASCFGCKFEHSKSYSVQGDSGHDVACSFTGTDRVIGDSTWKTPEWCPFLADGVRSLIGLKIVI